ncbi:hypothetical protein BJX66DRAFT_304209 [Aspergillus keveii]|uniref:Uncharacterized protein n=1 Tax=Aspergillus keveii TaxID=714993 RepID=A0ABR4G5R0_9EURO
METASRNATYERRVVIKREREASIQLDAPASPPANTRSSYNTRSTENTASLTNTSPTGPSTLRVTVEPRPASKAVPFPPALKTLLEEWHEKKGREIPPCKYFYQKRGGGSVVTQAYDREGRVVKMTEFSISTPVAYGVLVAHYPDNSVKLVSSLFPGSRKYGSYYRGWSGIEQGFEQEATVVRHFANSKIPDVTYRPEAWPALEELLKKDEHKKGQPASTVQEARSSPSSETRKRTATHESINAPPAKRHQTDQRESSSSGSEETDSSDEDEETDEEEPEREEEEKKTMVNQRPTVASSQNYDYGAESLPANKPELRFKLTFFKFRIQNVREFPEDECKTGKELFEKASAFFSIFDDAIQVKVLSCQIASRPDQHYIFAGSEGEFNLLLLQAQEAASALGKPLTIEVGLVRS